MMKFKGWNACINLGTHANVIKAKQALNSIIKGLETRKYNPRKYKELFKIV